MDKTTLETLIDEVRVLYQYANDLQNPIFKTIVLLKIDELMTVLESFLSIEVETKTQSN